MPIITIERAFDNMIFLHFRLIPHWSGAERTDSEERFSSMGSRLSAPLLFSDPALRFENDPDDDDDY